MVIGGLSSIAGAMLGALWVVGLPTLFNDSVQIGLLTSGAGLLVLLLYFPGGLVQVALQPPRRPVRLLARRGARDRRRATDAEHDLPSRLSWSRREIPRRRATR